jgi:hypothetical protein
MTNAMNILHKTAHRTLIKVSLAVMVVLFVYGLALQSALAASLSLSPGTGVYTSGSTFTVNVRVNTQ